MRRQSTQIELGFFFKGGTNKTDSYVFVLQEEFGYNADTQKLLSKNGETLLGAINFFISSVNTLVEKTIEDTMINIKQYETARWVYRSIWGQLETLQKPGNTTLMLLMIHCV